MTDAAAETVRQLQVKIGASPAPTDSVAEQDAPVTAGPESPPLSKLHEVVLQDVTRRHENLVQLIYHSDRKALQLLGVYAAASGIVLMGTLASLQHVGVMAAISAFTIIPLLYTGMIYSYRAHWSANMYLTGLKPDFWRWALEYEVSPDVLIEAYLTKAEESLKHNEGINTDAARNLCKSYYCGIIALGGTVFLILACLAKAVSCRIGLFSNWAWVCHF